MNAKELLNLAFDELSTTLEFDPRWKNGTGYFDNAVKGDNAPKLENGAMVKAQDDKGRKLILIGTSRGNVVLFERYSDPTSTIVVGNMPGVVADIFGSLIHNGNGSYSTEGVAKLMGVFYAEDRIVSFGMDNVGDTLAGFVKN